MTKDQIKLVENSWDFVLMNSDEIGKMFYRKLFETNPSLKDLFKEDMNNQSKKLISTVTFLIHKLDNLDLVIQDVVSLGKRHSIYNVKPWHYNAVGSALLDSLEKILKDRWTYEVKMAWLA